MYIVLPFLIIYLIYLFIFLLLKKSDGSKRTNKEIKISVVVAAKNEERKIFHTINSLANQDYSNNNFEVILVDDNSSDGTYEKAIAQTERLENFRVIKAVDKEFVGKRGALNIGIENSKHEFIVFTDADCILNNKFLNAFSAKFVDSYELVFGIAPYNQSGTVLNKLICYDNLWVHILSFSFAKIGLSYSAAGRSFGIKKNSFYKINGYKNTIDTLSGDDDLLLREAVKKKMSIGVILSADAFVFSEAENSLKDFLIQKARHTSTSNYYSLKTKIFLGTWHLINQIMLFSPLFITLERDIIFLFFAKIIFDIIIVKMLMKKFSYTFNTIEILGLIIYHGILLIVVYFGSFFRKSKW